MKILKWILIPLLIIVLLFGGLVIGGHFYIKNNYGINVFSTLSQFRALRREADTSEILTNAFSEEDMVDVQALVNQSVEDMISYSEEHGYSVNFGNLPPEMKTVIKLNDKQVGALAQTVIEQQFNGGVSTDTIDVGVTLMQMDFSKTQDNKDLLNSVFKLDFTPVINNMSDEFPESWLKKKIPTEIYVSSTVIVEKGEQPFSYSVSHHSITMNNLDEEETEEFLDTLDRLMNSGSAKEFNELIGKTIMDAMVGTAESEGVAYSLKSIGATDFSFENEGVVDYFVISRG